jgi:hypothetical protein
MKKNGRCMVMVSPPCRRPVRERSAELSVEGFSGTGRHERDTMTKIRAAVRRMTYHANDGREFPAGHRSRVVHGVREIPIGREGGDKGEMGRKQLKQQR